MAWRKVLYFFLAQHLTLKMEADCGWRGWFLCSTCSWIIHQMYSGDWTQLEWAVCVGGPENLCMPWQVLARGSVCTVNIQEKVNVGQPAAVTGCELELVFWPLLGFCRATSAFRCASSPTGFTQGTCNLSNKALCEPDRKTGGNNLPKTGSIHAFLLENEASGKMSKYWKSG